MIHRIRFQCNGLSVHCHESVYVDHMRNFRIILKFRLCAWRTSQFAKSILSVWSRQTFFRSGSPFSSKKSGAFTFFVSFSSLLCRYCENSSSPAHYAREETWPRVRSCYGFWTLPVFRKVNSVLQVTAALGADQESVASLSRRKTGARESLTLPCHLNGCNCDMNWTLQGSG